MARNRTDFWPVLKKSAELLGRLNIFYVPALERSPSGAERALKRKIHAAAGILEDVVVHQDGAVSRHGSSETSRQGSARADSFDAGPHSPTLSSTALPMLTRRLIAAPVTRLPVAVQGQV
jgi:hypothetical protein